MTFQTAFTIEAHAVLGARLRACTQLALNIQGRSAEQVFGYPDDLKFRSCMTLFAEVGREEPLFRQALQQYFAAEPDLRTLEILSTR